MYTKKVGTVRLHEPKSVGKAPSRIMKTTNRRCPKAWSVSMITSKSVTLQWRRCLGRPPSANLATLSASMRTSDWTVTTLTSIKVIRCCKMRRAGHRWPWEHRWRLRIGSVRSRSCNTLALPHPKTEDCYQSCIQSRIKVRLRLTARPTLRNHENKVAYTRPSVRAICKGWTRTCARQSLQSRQRRPQRATVSKWGSGSSTCAMRKTTSWATRNSWSARMMSCATSATQARSSERHWLIHCALDWAPREGVSDKVCLFVS